MDKYMKFREKFKNFIYDDFTYNLTDDSIHVRYSFIIPGLIEFNPEFRVQRDISVDIDKNLLEEMLFSLGLVELVSYWKCTCSPNVLIKTGYLDENQISWWKKLYFNGLGEFFHINKINASDDFMNITCSGNKKEISVFKSLSKKVLIPIGGGKDSLVTLDALKNNFDVSSYIINPRKTTTDGVIVSGIKNNINSTRILDKKIIEINSLGYLNGHTPFSAIVAFTSLLTAYLNGFKYIALSNESSSNESTVIGTNVNHQYSKSFEFEEDFRYYNEKYLKNDINYFSFLRPLTELQIAKIFSRQKNYHPVFKSCNVGSKKDLWCASCPKCLFVYIILSPYLSEEEMIEIFEKNMLSDEVNSENFEKLTGILPEKPFECVGLIDEVYASCKMLIEKGYLPKLIEKYKKVIEEYNLKIDYNKYYETENNLPLEFDKVLKAVVGKC